jgi:hypothetical protein
VESVKQLLEAEGTSVEELEINEPLNYDGGDAYDDLTIEKVRDGVISVEQHYMKRMDRMSVPEVRFDVSDPEDWEIVSYTDHGSYEETEYGKMQIHRTEEEVGEAEREFVELWDKNLQSQFPAEQVAGGENP